MATGYIRTQDKETARELGIKKVFLNPTSIQKLTEIVQNLIEEVRSKQDSSNLILEEV